MRECIYRDGVSPLTRPTRGAALSIALAAAGSPCSGGVPDDGPDLATYRRTTDGATGRPLAWNATNRLKLRLYLPEGGPGEGWIIDTVISAIGRWRAPCCAIRFELEVTVGDGDSIGSRADGTNAILFRRRSWVPVLALAVQATGAPRCSKLVESGAAGVMVPRFGANVPHERRALSRAEERFLCDAYPAR